MTPRRGASDDRRALLAVAGQFFVNGAVVASFVPRLPEIRDRLDLGVDGIGLVLTAAGVLGFVGSTLVTAAIGRFGTRRVMIGGGLGLMVGLALIGVGNHVAIVLVGLASVSFFDVLVDAAMNLQASWLSGRRTTPVIHRLHGLWSLGTVVGGVVSARAAASGVPIHTHLLVAAGILGLVLVVVARGLLVHDQPAEADAAPSGVRTARRSALSVLALLGAAAFAVEITSSDWAAFRLTDDLGASPGVAGLGFVAFTVGMTVSRFAGDWVQARLGPDHQLDLSLVVAAVGIGGASFVPSQAGSLVLFVVAGIGIAPLFPRIYDDAARRPGRRGAGLGALTAGSRVASFVAPALVGWLAASDLSVGGAVALVVLPSFGAMAVSTRSRTIVRSGT